MGNPYPRDTLRLLLQPSRRHRLRRPGRAALRLDRPRHGGNWRLGHAAPLRKTVVRKASALVLGRGTQLQALRRERSCRAAAQRHLRATRHACAGVAGATPLWRGNGSLAAASASDHRRHDRLLSRRCHGYALQRHAHHRYGLRRRRPGPRAKRTHADSSSNALAPAPSFRFLPWLGRTRQRSRRHHSLRRRHFFLGALHQALARRLPPPSSRRPRLFLPHRSPVVHPLRPPQSRFLPHLHHRTQFQALPHARIPAYPAPLVLHPSPSRCVSSMDCDLPLVFRLWCIASVAYPLYEGIYLVSTILGWILFRIFYDLTI